MAHRRASRAALCAIVGGGVWALTPLRQPVFGAGRTADEGEMFFRGYNLLVVAVALSLTLALVHLRRRTRVGAGTAFRAGWWIVLVGHGLIVAGSVLAVVLGGSAPGVVTAGQDAGFLGAILAALGGIPLGVAGLRRGLMPRAAAGLFVATMPLGLLAMAVLTAVGVPEDYLGLPLTVPYGAAWTTLGAHWIHAHTRSSGRRAD